MSTTILRIYTTEPIFGEESITFGPPIPKTKEGILVSPRNQAITVNASTERNVATILCNFERSSARNTENTGF